MSYQGKIPVPTGDNEAQNQIKDVARNVGILDPMPKAQPGTHRPPPKLRMQPAAAQDNAEIPESMRRMMGAKVKREVGKVTKTVTDDASDARSNTVFIKDDTLIEAMSDDTKLTELVKDKPRLIESLSAALNLDVPGLDLDEKKLAQLESKLGADVSSTAAALLDKVNPLSSATRLFDWAVSNADVSKVNDKKKGAAALTLDSLWRKGRWTDLTKLIDAGWDTGQPKEGGPGYSGFTMPLAHQASGWLHLVDKRPEDIDPNKTHVPDLETFNKDKQEWLKRRQGVTEVIKAIAAQQKKTGEEDGILTSYDDVRKSDVMTAFKKNPGTFWGFENIRMPFVQCARETKTEPKGQSGDKDAGQSGAQAKQPVSQAKEESGDAMVLRMMDMWPVLGKLTTHKKYDELMKNPQQAINTLINEGLSHDDVANRSADFKKAFEKEVRSFLERLVNEKEIDDPQVTEARGIKTGSSKFIGAVLCKHGLEWLREKGEGKDKEEREKLYYCLDGIDENDFIGYRQVKHEQIKDKGGHDKVITLVELRHIVRNWSSLKDTVVFTRGGKLLADQDKMVEDWAKRIEEDKAKAGARPLRANPADVPILKTEIDQMPAKKLEGLDQGQLFDIARAAALIRRATSAGKSNVLVNTLKNKRCKLLFERGLLPDRDTLLAHCEALIEAGTNPTELQSAHERLHELAWPDPGFRNLIGQWANKK